MEKILLKDKFESLLPAEVQEVLLSCAKIAEENDFKIYLVGGVVRDLILENKICDIDVIVEGDAVRFVKILEKSMIAEIIQIQQELKTAKVMFGENIEIDFASTREEEYPKAGFLPVIKEFGVSIDKDAKRRDFTINSLYMPLLGGNAFELIDFYAGYYDIKYKYIRVLHDKSFIDDPSRIIRGLKFAARLGFELDNHTKELQDEYLSQEKCFDFPLERIKCELKDLFSLDCFACAFDEFIKSRAYLLFCGGIDSGVTGANLHNAATLFNIKPKDVWFLCLAVCLVNVSDICLEKLNLNSTESKIITELFGMLHLPRMCSNTNIEIYKFFEGKSNISLAAYYVYTEDQKTLYFYNDLKDIKLLISGEEIIALGLKPSKRFKELLDKVLEAKLDGKIATFEEEKAYLQAII